MDSLASHARGTGYWLLLLVLVPVLAAVAAGFIVAVQPSQYTATGLVRVDPPPGTTRNQATGIYVDAVTSRPVIESAAAEVGVPADDVRPYISADARSAEGAPTGLVNVQYEGPDQQQAAPIATAVAIGAQQFLYAAPIASAEAAVAVAEEDFAEASAAANEVGLAQKEADLRAYQARLNFLRNNKDPQEAVADIAEAQAAVDAAQQELAEVAVISEELDSKEAILRSARKSLSALQGQLEAATAPSSVTMSAVTTVDSSVAVVRAAVTGAILGFAIAAIVVAGVAVVRSRPAMSRGSRSKEAASEQAPTVRRQASPPEVQLSAHPVDGLASI